MKEEKNINAKVVLKLLLGNKWLYLIMAACFLAVSFIGLNLYNQGRKEYVAFFDYDVAGFETTTLESGEEYRTYIDGEKFDPRSIITKDKLVEYIRSNPALEDVDVNQIYKRNVVKSFKYTTRYKENDHKMDEKDSAYIEDKKGFELVLETNCLNEAQAKALSENIANEVVKITKNKIDEIRYNSYLKAFDNSSSYSDKIANLVSGISYVKDLSSALKDKYGDVVIPSGNYGGEGDTYYLEPLTISHWQNDMKIKFDSYYVESLISELQVNGFISPQSEDYIASIKTTVENLNRDISVNENILNSLTTQRDSLVTSVGSNASVESLEIREYNTEIISLTKVIAEQKEQVDLYKLQLEKLEMSGMTDEQIASYYANLALFENKMGKIRDDLEFYTKQYEAIAKEIMKENSNVYFDSSDIISVGGDMNIFVIIFASVFIGAVAPMLINLLIAGFNIADGKPLFKKREENNKQLSNE